VFVLLDMSWTFENKIDAMKVAVNELIDSLSEWDYFQFIGYADTATS